MTYRTHDSPMDSLRVGRMVTNDEAAQMMIKTAETLVARARDAMFEVNKPLQAGPAPIAPDQGTIYDGNGPRRVPGAGTEEIRRKIRLAHPELSDADIEDVLAAMKFSGTQGSAPIGEKGGARPTGDRRRAFDNDQANIRSMQEQMNALWEPIHAEFDRQIHGHVR